MRAMNLILLDGYWRMGKRLRDDLMTTEGENEGSTRSTLMRLADDLDLEYSFLTRVMKLYDLWPHGLAIERFPNLTWTHYRALLAVPDEKERQFYLERTDEHVWNVRELRAKIKENFYKIAAGYKKKSATQTGTTLTRPGGVLHYYVAEVERVVDGDTLILHIDLGFKVWFSQRVRLRGIDCPERSTPEGQQAKEFVEERLSRVERITFRSTQIDIYGRYVTDIFYLPGEGDKERIIERGNYLNQELLDEGLAQML
ncbi:MAG: thermonuclease family protein [Candidatus Omnitrophica bacterium]|nr:thermonuclease family protein [Candidatus Omnitrophota bacterium]